MTSTMSRTVHILKLYHDNLEYFSPFREEHLYNAFLTMKYNDGVLKNLVESFNLEKGISVGPLLFKGLSKQRLRILLALMAQQDKVKLNLKYPYDEYIHMFNMKKTPKRFREKFIPLLVNGFYLVGTVIEDSLNEDPSINCNNPFCFEVGDLGFWWAGVVILDWIKYFNERSNSKDETKYHLTRCEDFYRDPCLSRKYKYNQNSALSSLNRIPQQFLQENDVVNFFETIGKIDYDLERIVCSRLRPYTEKAKSVCEALAQRFGMTLEECHLKYRPNSEDDED